jgi:hypothetical protein
MRAALLVAIAACSFPEKHAGPSDGSIAVDAAPDAETPFSCGGMPFQTTAPAHITISGAAIDLGTGAIAANVPVTGVAGSATVFSTTTDGSGDFSSVIATGGAAVAAYVVTSGSAYAPSYFYPAHPFVDDAMTPLPMLTPSELATLNPAGSGFAQLLVGDCLGNGLAGCTVEVTPAPELVEYSKNGKPDPTATSTEASGYVLVEGLVAGGSSSFVATCPTAVLRAASVPIAPDSTYFIELEP